jgi:hypothetical protein
MPDGDGMPEGDGIPLGMGGLCGPDGLLLAQPDITSTTASTAAAMAAAVVPVAAVSVKPRIDLVIIFLSNFCPLAALATGAIQPLPVVAREAVVFDARSSASSSARSW